MGEGYRFIGRPLTVLLWIHSSVEERGERNYSEIAGTHWTVQKTQEVCACACARGTPRTCLRDLTAHSSRVSAASSLPWRRYRAPRFLRVVFTVGLDVEKKEKKSQRTTKVLQNIRQVFQKYNNLQRIKTCFRNVTAQLLMSDPWVLFIHF